jgi:hypothetical protein
MMIRSVLLCVGFFAVLSPVAMGQPEEDSSTLHLFAYLVNKDPAVRDRAAEILGRSGDRSVAPAFIQALRLVPPGREWHRAMKNLTGERFGSDWGEWMEWLGQQEIIPHPDYLTFKLSVLQVIDPAFLQFFPGGVTMTIRPDLIVWGGVQVDGIPALLHPRLNTAGGASYLQDDEPVFGVEINGVSRAYPLRIVNWHEMVNDTVGGIPVSLAYCTLCGSAMLFETSVGDTTYTFGSSGFLYESNKLMYDHQTKSLWASLHGKPVVGPLAHEDMQLHRLPVVRTSWATWKTDHPTTTVLSLETGFDRDYIPGGAYKEYFESDETMFPVARRSDIRDTKEWVFGVLRDGIARAYPLEELEDYPILNDAVGSDPVVVLSDVEQLSVRVYLRGDHQFVRREESTLVDGQGGVWTVREGHLENGTSGHRLPRLGGHLAFWFGWYAFFPETTVYED